jgi:hypothetical protein
LAPHAFVMQSYQLRHNEQKCSQNPLIFGRFLTTFVFFRLIIEKSPELLMQAEKKKNFCSNHGTLGEFYKLFE